MPGEVAELDRPSLHLQGLMAWKPPMTESRSAPRGGVVRGGGAGDDSETGSVSSLFPRSWTSDFGLEAHCACGGESR
jgi:hypothetical protein